jgi:hypothetical protein
MTKLYIYIYIHTKTHTEVTVQNKKVGGIRSTKSTKDETPA